MHVHWLERLTALVGATGRVGKLMHTSTAAQTLIDGVLISGCVRRAVRVESLIHTVSL